MKKIDSVTLEIIGNLLLSIAEEMGMILVKTAYSTNIKERKDCSSAVFDRSGNMIAQAEYVPMHLGSMLSVVQNILVNYSIEEIHEGDVFVTNDPYSGGGTHLPDITMVSPCFYKDELIGFVSNIAHHSDLGGIVPGSVSAASTSIFQEGLRIPLVKICDRGLLVHESFDFITLNTRTPDERKGDLEAMIASVNAGKLRLEETAEKYKPDVLLASMTALLDYAEKLFRSTIKEIPNGVYTFEDYLDDAGTNHPSPVKIKTAITIEEEDVYLNFEGTSQQVNGPLNLTFSGLLTTVFYTFKAVAGTNIMANHGIYRALHVKAPEKSIVNCALPVPVGQRVDTCQRVVDVILGALSKAIPEKVIAACNSSVTSAIFSGNKPETDEYFVYLETIAGGGGASCLNDGLSGVQAHMTNTSNLPVEVLETEYPILVEAYKLLQDSGGPGYNRGGLGIQRKFKILKESVEFTGLGDRHLFTPWGIAGGKSGSAGSYYFECDENGTKLPSKISELKLKTGDTITMNTPGAGGYGDPRRREPERVLKDVKEGKVSIMSAAKEYEVAICFRDGVYMVDKDQTEELRKTAVGQKAMRKEADSVEKESFAEN